MGKIVVVNHVTLDGVMQSPSGLDEDRRGGFEHGGWAARNTDEVLGRFMGARMAKGGDGAMLFGRRTYEKMASFWPKQTDGNPFTEVLNARQKYVASRTLTAPLDWENSTLLDGDVAEAVAAVKQQVDLVVLGSGDLLETLMRADLVDEWVLPIHPVVLGTGRRLFPDGVPPAALELTSTTPTTTGVIIATYAAAS
jgi:dihydrofolate reductase